MRVTDTLSTCVKGTYHLRDRFQASCLSVPVVMAHISYWFKSCPDTMVSQAFTTWMAAAPRDSTLVAPVLTWSWFMTFILFLMFVWRSVCLLLQLGMATEALSKEKKKTNFVFSLFCFIVLSPPKRVLALRQVRLKLARLLFTHRALCALDSNALCSCVFCWWDSWQKLWISGKETDFLFSH